MIASLGGYFRSYPLPSERLAQAHRLIAEEHWEALGTQQPFRAPAVGDPKSTGGA